MNEYETKTKAGNVNFSNSEKLEKADAVVKKITQQLDQSITSLDQNTKESLAASRQAALAEVDRRESQPFFTINWKQTAAFSGALVIMITTAVTVFIGDEQAQFSNEKADFLTVDYGVSDDAVVAEYELLNELEFISWLVEEEHDNNAS